METYKNNRPFVAVEPRVWSVYPNLSSEMQDVLDVTHERYESVVRESNFDSLETSVRLTEMVRTTERLVIHYFERTTLYKKIIAGSVVLNLILCILLYLKFQ